MIQFFAFDRIWNIPIFFLNVFSDIWNIEYSIKKKQQQRKYRKFWNIEYSSNIKKKVKQLKLAKVWNMEYSMNIKRKVKQLQYAKFWNMQYSRNIKKKVNKTTKICQILEYGIFH